MPFIWEIDEIQSNFFLLHLFTFILCIIYFQVVSFYFFVSFWEAFSSVHPRLLVEEQSVPS